MGEYAAAIGVMVVNEVSFVCKRVDDGMRTMELELRAQTCDMVSHFNSTQPDSDL